MRSRSASFGAVLVACAALAGAARGQSLAGTVHDSVSGLPVAGAVVMALDSAGTTVTRGLTNERGEYLVAWRDAARTARFVRIGFVPLDVALPPRAGSLTHLDVVMFSLPSMLAPKRVLANSHCSTRGDRAAALGLWEQARAGLLATIVARETNPARLHRLGFERVMDGNSDRIERMRVRADSADTVATSFFAAHSAADLVRYGFSTDSTNTATFFGPDADVLLDDYFAGAYCFQLTKGPRTRPDQVGLRFVPAEHRRGHIDIDGTLWIDTLARALKDIEFKYVGMSVGAMRFNPGGHISFQSMPDGVVLIDRWSLRLVSAEPDTVLDKLGNPEPRDWLYADESGGELAHASWPDGTVWNARLGALRLTATNHEGQPAAGAVIALAATHYFGTANSRGIVEIRDLLPGPYVVRVIDPQVAVLGIGLPTSLRFTAARDTTTIARLMVPTARQFAVERCSSAGQKTNGSSALAVLGRVVSARGDPVSGVKITVATRMNSPQADGTNLIWLRDFFTTGPDGLFQLCHDWDIGNEIVILAHRPGAADQVIQAQFTSDIVVVRVLAVSR
jgi:hypothetical protein